MVNYALKNKTSNNIDLKIHAVTKENEDKITEAMCTANKINASFAIIGDKLE